MYESENSISMTTVAFSASTTSISNSTNILKDFQELQDSSLSCGSITDKSSVTLKSSISTSSISEKPQQNQVMQMQPHQKQQQQNQEQNQEQHQQQITSAPLSSLETILAPPRVSGAPPLVGFNTNNIGSESYVMAGAGSNLNLNFNSITTAAAVNYVMGCSTNNGNVDDGIGSGDDGVINVEELIRENIALREKLKEITTDRDRLLCEVANLRLELDMAELKRLPEER